MICSPDGLGIFCKQPRLERVKLCQSPCGAIRSRECLFIRMPDRLRAPRSCCPRKPVAKMFWKTVILLHGVFVPPLATKAGVPTIACHNICSVRICHLLCCNKWGCKRIWRSLQEYFGHLLCYVLRCSLFLVSGDRRTPLASSRSLLRSQIRWDPSTLPGNFHDFTSGKAV